jgi:predicted enzyme related to lactoylglutathione lyase
MLADTKSVSGFAVDDVEKAKQFYGETLGLGMTVADEEHGVMNLHLAEDREMVVYAKPDLQPGNYTILNFSVDDIDAAVDELSSRGVIFEHYDGMPQDEKGVMREGFPYIAWFKDPAGNILAVMQER